MKKFFSKLSLALILMILSDPSFAVEKFRYLHVTIETPWIIFLFLLVIIMFPFLLTAILYWYFAYKKNAEEKNAQQQSSAE